MTTLCDRSQKIRALVGASFLLAVMGCVVFVPLGWGLVLGIGLANPEMIAGGTLEFR